MEKFNFTTTRGGEKMESKERHNSPDIVKDLFQGDCQKFRKLVLKAVEDENRGGFESGTPGFCQQVFDGVKVEKKFFYKYRGQIMKLVKEIKKEGGRLDNPPRDPLASNKNIMNGAIIAERKYRKERKMLGKDD